MIDFSPKRKARAKDEGLDPRQLAVAELMAWGWDALDAMLAVDLVRENDTKADAMHTTVNYTSSEAFDRLLKKRVKQMRGGCVLDEYQKIHPTPGGQSDGRGRKRADAPSNKPSYLERKLWQGDVTPVSDEEILAAMWDTITKLDASDPKRVDLLDKYDKLKRRQGADGDNDTTIHFYLPRPECDTCPYRGNHVITEPEPDAKPEEEFKVKKPKSYYIPHTTLSANGKKLGRPSKEDLKKKAENETAQEESDTETT